MVYAEKNSDPKDYFISPTDKLVNIISFSLLNNYLGETGSFPASSQERPVSKQCWFCEASKRHKSVSEGHALLLKEPRKPRPTAPEAGASRRCPAPASPFRAFPAAALS